MAESHWLALFTGQTWEEFLTEGARVVGFRGSRLSCAQNIDPGDYFLCYITGISRFIGILHVKSKYYIDKSPIWKNEVFPIRFKVELITRLSPKSAVPVLALRETLSIFDNVKPGGYWSGFFRSAPVKFKGYDAEVIMEAIKIATRNPIERDFDKKKYWRYPSVIEPTMRSSHIFPTSDKAMIDFVE